MPSSSMSALPKIFRWVFTVLAAIAGVAAIAIGIAILVDPHLPAGTHFGPAQVDFGGQPGSVTLTPMDGDFDFIVTAFRGTIVLFVHKAGGLVEVVKHTGLPVVLIGALFSTALFELLRRLFRNVGRGESFTPQTVRLVQILGVSLLVYSVVSAFAENWFAFEVFGYALQHTTVTISGAQLHLPTPTHMTIPSGRGFPFGTPFFDCGLLVLALSEVFRQGLALKSEHDLTV